MKKTTRALVCMTAAFCLLTACSKDKPASSNTGKPAPTPTQESQTYSNIKVTINDITAYAGEEIDYIGAIKSAENMEINRSMIYVDSSAVDSHTPGSYLAVYTFDYLGTTVTSSIKVTILENPAASTTETTSPKETETAAAEPESEIPAETSAGDVPAASTEESSPDEPAVSTAENQEAQQTILSTEPVSATVEQQLPDASITLSSGKVVSIKCTSNRYITETYTDEYYFKEDGLTFLTSELKILFNTGEIQVIETVVTRVQPPTDAPQ